MRGLAVLATVLFFLLPTFVMSGDIDGAAAAKIALPGILTLVVLLASFAVVDRLVDFVQAAAPAENDEPIRSDPPKVAALGLYFACVLLGGLALVLYFREHPVIDDLVAWDFSGRRPGFLLIGLPLILLLGYARWLDRRPDS